MPELTLEDELQHEQSELLASYAELADSMFSYRAAMEDIDTARSRISHLESLINRNMPNGADIGQDE